MLQTHRERVRAVLAGERPARPVVDLGGRVASLNTRAYLDLKAHLGFGAQLDGETVTLLNTIGQPDERVLECFDVSIRRVYLRSAYGFEVTPREDGMFFDEWSVGYRPMGEYNERVLHPLADATLEDLDRFAWPDPSDPGRVEGLREEAALFHDTDFCLAAGHISAGIFQDCWNLRGMDRFLEDMVLNVEFAEALLDRVTDTHIGMWDAFLGAVGEFVDIVETADDLGTQNSTLISPRLYRSMIKPRHARLNEAIRRKTDARILYHSCGAIMPLIADLIEIGVNILNPIQPLPGLMDPEGLKARFGDHLVFHGGLDVQRLLLFSTPAEVKAHVRRYLAALGTERYIMAPANSVQPGTPPENIVAAYRSAAEL